MTLFCIGSLIVCVLVIVRYANNCIVTEVHHAASACYLEALSSNPIAPAVGSMCFLSVWSLLSLSGYHIYLISTGQTTNEHMREMYAGMHSSPYNYGCWQNFRIACWEDLPESQLSHLSHEISDVDYLSTLTINVRGGGGNNSQSLSSTSDFSRYLAAVASNNSSNSSSRHPSQSTPTPAPTTTTHSDPSAFVSSTRSQDNASIMYPQSNVSMTSDEVVTESQHQYHHHHHREKSQGEHVDKDFIYAPISSLHF